MQPPSPFSPGSDAGAPGGWAGVAGGRGGGTVIKPTLSPAASPVIDVAMVRALELARAAGAAGEVPVGAVVLSPEGAVLSEAANAREVAVATGKLVSGEGKAAVGSVRVDDFTPMIEFLASHKILGDKKTPKAADVCVPLTQ